MANRVLEAFRRCYTWALSRGLVTTTPFVAIDKPAQVGKATRTYTNDEVRIIFAAVAGIELEDFVPLLFHTATRSGETRAMRWSHVDPGAAETIRVQASARRFHRNSPLGCRGRKGLSVRGASM